MSSRRELEYIEVRSRGTQTNCRSVQTNSRATQKTDRCKQEDSPRMQGQGTRQKRKRKRKYRGRFVACAVLLIACTAFVLHLQDSQQVSGQNAVYKIAKQALSGLSGSSSRGIQKELEELLENNQEAAEFVAGYRERDTYIGQSIDLTEDFETGTVPLLMQWDKRWGYDVYGDSIIGLSGCGPTCLTMAYLYFTEDTTENPRTMAEFADENGFYTVGGTSWSLWTEGAELLGLSGQELPLDEKRMKSALDNDGLIVCSMRPGDFTTTGHFILIRGYDEEGFFVNDPNRMAHSQRQWSYKDLSRQIKNLWVLADQ